MVGGCLILAVAARAGGHLYNECLEDICLWRSCLEDICPILAVAAVVGGHLYNKCGVCGCVSCCVQLIAPSNKLIMVIN